jgi:N,N'-diacetyllegionaminate synthase
MKPFVIAEIGVNHDGSLEKAIKLVSAAKSAGASAAKFQSFSADRLASEVTPKVEYQKIRDGERTHFEMLQQLELSFSDQTKLKKYCDSIGIEFISTPYAIEDAIFLNSINVRYFKIASADIVDLPLLEYVSNTKKLTLISTGMASIDEIKCAAKFFHSSNSNFVLMHTTSEYPTKLEFTNISRLKALIQFNPSGIGFSDHTTDSIGAIMAIAIGATYFEKHFTLNKSDSGPDHAASLEPEEFKRYVLDIQNGFEALGSAEFIRTAGEEGMAKTSRKSLHYSRDLEVGNILGISDLVLLRPGTGMMWRECEVFLGRALKHKVAKSTILRSQDFE